MQWSPGTVKSANEKLGASSNSIGKRPRSCVPGMIQIDPTRQCLKSSPYRPGTESSNPTPFRQRVCKLSVPLSPLLQWVEQGVAPDQIIAFKVGHRVQSRGRCDDLHSGIYRGVPSISVRAV